MKKITKALSGISLAAIASSVFVSAQPGESFLGGMENDILKTVFNIISYPFKVPNLTGSPNEVPFWMVILGFTLLFSIIYPASKVIPLFKNAESKGPQKAFAIAFSLIVIFSTKYLEMIHNIIYAFTSIALLALLVLGVYTIWVLFKGGWAENSKLSADSSAKLAQAAQINADAAKESGKAKEAQIKVAHAADRGLKNQVKAIRTLRSDLQTVAKDLGKVRDGRMRTAFGRNFNKKLQRDISKISQDLSNIISFETENDRLMTAMKSKDYEENASLGSIGAPMKAYWGNKKIQIDKDKAAQTSDLGRILAGAGQEIRDHGVTGANAPKLLEWIGNAINITNRMERDIVLEEQMIEKL